MMWDWIEEKLQQPTFWILLIGGWVFAIVLFWVIGSSIEASAYERVAGIEVSTWEAMWLELRVDGCVR